jgi:hypothetical protein
MFNPYEIDVVTDGREYMECAECGFKGIGWVQFISNGSVDAFCDICGNRSANETLWRAPYEV